MNTKAKITRRLEKSMKRNEWKTSISFRHKIQNDKWSIRFFLHNFTSYYLIEITERKIQFWSDKMKKWLKMLNLNHSHYFLHSPLIFRTLNFIYVQTNVTETSILQFNGLNFWLISDYF